jgi:RimJ/RimL family protein N-acetyltransferase
MPAPLALRPLHEGDADVLLHWVEGADALVQWSGTGRFTWPLDRGQLRRDIAAAGRRRLVLGAVAPDGDELLGTVTLTIVPEHGRGHIGGVMVAPAHRGRGLGRSLMAAVLALGFDEHRLHRLELAVYDFNRPAIATYQALGFRVEGVTRESARAGGAYWTAYSMALLEPEYRAGGGGADGIRPARPGDAPALAALLAELGRPVTDAQTGERLLAWRLHQSAEVLVLEQAGVAVGVVAVAAIPRLHRDTPMARVGVLAVAPGHRGRGLGRSLLAAAESWARERGCGEVEITSPRERAAAHAFYRRHGYEDRSERAARFVRAL